MDHDRLGARQCLVSNNIPVEVEDIVFDAQVPYANTIRRLVRGMPLHLALGKDHVVAEGVVQCRKCKGYRVMETTAQTSCGDEGGRSFYYCTECQNKW